MLPPVVQKLSRLRAPQDRRQIPSGFSRAIGHTRRAFFCRRSPQQPCLRGYTQRSPMVRLPSFSSGGGSVCRSTFLRRRSTDALCRKESTAGNRIHQNCLCALPTVLLMQARRLPQLLKNLHAIHAGWSGRYHSNR